MKKTLSIAFSLFLIFIAVAQEKFHIIKTDNSEWSFNTALIDSVIMESSNTVMKIYKSDSSTESFNVSEVSYMHFTGTPDTVK